MIRHIFSSSIRLELFDFGGELIFNEELKFHKAVKDFRFVIKRIDPSESREIINKDNMVFASTDRGNGRCPNIQMNQIQRLKRNPSRSIERLPFTFA